MDVTGYISEIEKCGEFVVGDKAMEILAYFSESDHMSAYDVFTAINKSGNKIAYKNVHKRVQRLLELNLIKPSGKGKKHGAKLYSLTNCGVFQIVRNSNRGLIDPRFINRYKSHPLFEIFLIPLLEIESLNHSVVNALALRYLRSIGERTVEAIRTTNLKEAMFDYKPIAPKELALMMFDWWMVSDQSNLVLSLLSLSSQRLPEKTIEVLGNDMKFMKHLHTTKERFDERYGLLNKYLTKRMDLGIESTKCSHDFKTSFINKKMIKKKCSKCGYELREPIVSRMSGVEAQK